VAASLPQLLENYGVRVVDPRELRLMNILSNLSFVRPRPTAIALAASLLSVGATSANAQWFNWDEALPPMRVERMIQASGYRLTGPVMRNGEVYLANVLGRNDDRERLIIDARDGRLLRRFAGAPRQRFAEGDWSGPSRPQGFFGGLFGRQDDDPPARVSANDYGDADDGLTRAPLVAPAPHPHPGQGGQVARADDSANPSSPTIIMGPSAAPNAPVLEKPKTKAQAKHKKPEPTPVAQPSDPKPAPVAALPAANIPQTPPSPPAAMTPSVAAPSHTEAAHEPNPAPAAVAADAKATTTPTPEPARAAPSSPAPKAVASKPALNDVPVAPLE
jgi:hypothetical protein